MRIAIEAQRIFRPNKHGMDFVALETIRLLQKIDKENEYFIFVSSGEDRCLSDSKNMRIIEVKCPTYALWEQYALPRAVAKVKPDILHCTSNTAPIFCSVPLILTLHDIIFLEKRQSNSKSLYQELGRHYRRLVVPRILSKCKRIITVSNFERNHICQTLNLPEEQIVAVYNGYNPHFSPQPVNNQVVHKYIDTEDYLFFLGNTDPKKNTHRVLKAYSLYLNKSQHKRKLLIADLKEDFIDAILQEENIQEIKSWLKFPGYIYNKDLAALYNAAFAFIYTSLRESFGIPMLESMACGTPVITSNTSAMPEIAGDQAILVDPFNPVAIAEKIILLENDQSFYNNQVAYGLDRVKKFSWEQTALNTLSIYKEVYSLK